MAHKFNPSTWQTEADRHLWVQGQPGLHSKFQANQGYIDPITSLVSRVSSSMDSTNCGLKLFPKVATVLIRYRVFLGSFLALYNTALGITRGLQMMHRAQEDMSRL